MIVVATSADHFEAPWVRNEWSRFLAFMSEDADKRIIPVYKNITAYELPDELSSYQAQDLSKIGALQDLVLGIESLLRNRDTTKKTMSEQDVLSIVKEKEERERLAASEARAKMISKLMKGLLALIAAFLIIIGMVKLLGYINKGYLAPRKVYNTAVAEMNNGNYDKAISAFSTINGFKDSDELYKKCFQLQQEIIVAYIL
ncbi:hypothetical protein SAMN04487928_105126 [Butyrivibrio proteoclasticus]|uniref:TIR domain-containing protein n=2 Tax=Butyrivibrio proteoclasticus TaxID=43305 RepID=A0A1I5S4T5_9FIRM|nr:hypothetical protein SAMN04487928_105126 [Butyrivibrio proteoclasticus]